MNSRLQQDLEQFENILETTKLEAIRILSGLETRAAAVKPEPFEFAKLSMNGIGFEATLEQFKTRFEPGFSGSAGPRYLGFVTGGATPAALAADWLTSTLDNNPASSLDSSAMDLERETIGMLREFFGISSAFSGCFVSGATMSNVVGLAIAREWIAEQHGVSIAQDGLHAVGPITVLSGTAHSSTFKALSMLGMGRSSLKPVPLLDNREAVDVEALEKMLEDLNGLPCIVVANSGTVNTVDFDDLERIAELKLRFDFWLHVDAAFGAFAALSPTYSSLMAGLEQADSICVDAHKWLNVPYDSAMQFNKRQDLQVKVFQNSAAYLGLPSEIPDFVHLTPENSRRLRALPAWFALNAYGLEGHREIIERHADLARALGERVSASSKFVLIAPVRLNVVCFTLKNADQTRVTNFIHDLRDGGDVFLTPTFLFGQPGIRAAFSNWRTSIHDLEIVWNAMNLAIKDSVI
jgi:glutamate/tyrosine decarboxylase-like PLP-dependent enzyme